MTKHVQMTRLELQVIKQKNETQNLESYTGMMSHEFRTPLGTCLMFIGLLLQMQLGHEAGKLIELIKHSLNLLLHLVNDIVDLKLIKEN